jgi:tetratricopeptide (TPR) repeat protein
MIKRVTVFIFLVFSVSLVKIEAQVSITDSLRSIVKDDLRDTVNVNNLNLLARGLGREGKFDESLKYAILARTIAKKINFRKGLGLSLLASGYTYKLKGAYQSALDDFEEAENIFRSISDFEGLGMSHNFMGYTYEDLSDYKQGFDHHLRALEFLTRANNPSSLATVNNGIGINCYRRGSYEVALLYHFKALKIADSAKLSAHQATSFNNIAVIYERLSDYKNALDYYSKSLLVLQREKMLPVVAKTLSNIGGVNIALGNYSEAKKNLDEAYKIRIQIGDKHQVYTLSNYGDLYMNLKKYDSAELYYSQSLKLAREMNNLEGELYPIKGLGNLYLLQGKLNKSFEYFDLAYTIARQINAKLWLEEIYYCKAKIDSARGDFKSSLAWFKLYDNLNDSLFSQMKNEKILYLQSAHNTENTWSKNSIVGRSENVRTKTNLQSTFGWPYLITIALLITLIIGVVVLYLQRRFHQYKS